MASNNDRDLVIRTILGEASDQGPAGQAAVANVIKNRLAAGRYGATPSAVVLAPNQFEPWSTRRRELMAINPNSAAYRNVGDIVDMVQSGDIPDNTNGATHFYAPALQAKLGRAKPSWAQSPTATIGGHVFYAPEGRVTQQPAAPPAAQQDEDVLDVINRAMKDPDQ